MLLRLEGVEKSYVTGEGPLPVLRGVDLTLDAGQSMALTGESGSGKSTLLHLVAGLDTPDRGTIMIAGRDITGLDDRALAALRRGTVGLIFQQYNLIPSLDVAANLAFQARLVGRYDPGFTAQLAERLGLSQLLSRYPEQLSGGQQQRVAIGRSLAARPKLVLADEPTGNLDEATGGSVLSFLFSLVRERNYALILVTHNDKVAGACHRVLRLRDGLLNSA
jgi:putative ABC transport system ATP-binding protein